MLGATVLASPERCRQVGYVAANFHNVGLPWGPHGIDMHAIRQAPSLYGGSVLQDSFFDGFGVATASYAYDAHRELYWPYDEDKAGVHRTLALGFGLPSVEFRDPESSADKEYDSVFEAASGYSMYGA